MSITLSMLKVIVISPKLILQGQLINPFHATGTAQKMKFSIQDFFSKCDQIRRKLWIWSHLLKKFLIENFILLYSVVVSSFTP